MQKEELKNEIKAAFMAVRTYDGSEGRTTDDAIEKISSDLASSIDRYAKELTIVADPAAVTASTMVAGPYPVAASNNLVSKVISNE